MKQTREILKTYFETGDKPTEGEFKELLDSFTHLNEFNFGIDVKPTGRTYAKYYHVYRAQSPSFDNGHKIIEGSTGENPPSFVDYDHLMSRSLRYKRLQIKTIGDINFTEHQPKLIIERYKQRKKLKSGFIKPAGFYKERSEEAAMWNRQSEYSLSSEVDTIDINPFQYFRPGPVDLPNSLYNFLPSGALSRSKSFKFSNNAKPFVPLQLRLQIQIDGNLYLSNAISLKIILGTNENDSINFIFD